MSLGLTYNDDLSRVQIQVTNLPAVATVTIERSTNQLYWETVRGGEAVPVSGGNASLDDYEFAADVPNYYRVTGIPAGLYLTGNSGSYASTPNHASFNVTDLDVRVWASTPDWSTTQRALFARSTSGNISWRLLIDPEGDPRLLWSTDGSAVTQQQSGTPFTVDSGPLAFQGTLDVNNGAAGRTIDFNTATSLAGPWTDHTNHVVAGTTSVFAGTAGLEVGSISGGTISRFDGIVFGAEALASIGGAAIANPDFTIHPTDTPSFTDAAGRLWTVNGDARIIGDPVFTASITPDLEGRVWWKCVRYPFLNRPVSIGDVDGDARASRGAVHEIQGRSLPVAVTDLRASSAFNLELRTATLAEARDMDLILAAGDVYLVHVPAGSQIPGGYVTVEGASMTRFGPVSTRRRWPLQCRIVAPPGPGVVGSTLTWGTVLGMYGSWGALLAANPTWADLLATVGSPDDLVVL